MSIQGGGDGDHKQKSRFRDGWSRAKGADGKLANRRERTARNRGDLDNPPTARPQSFIPKSKKRKTVRHLTQKYMHEIREHIDDVANERKYCKIMGKRYGANWRTQRGGLAFHHRRYRWHMDTIKKLFVKIRAAGGETNFLKLKDKF